MELVYKLKELDYLFDHVRADFLQSDIAETTLNRYYAGNMNEFFDQEYFDINGARWLTCAYLRKSDGNVGLIHSDVVDDDSLCPAINILLSGTTYMEFWDPKKPENECLGIISKQRKIRNYNHITWPADYSYTMERGIYLINATGPHRATCQGDRHLFSLRSPELYTRKWPDIVGQFSDLIVT